MSDKQKLIKARIGLLQLAQELGNIKAACQRAGISRSHFYEIKEAYEKHGAEGLEPKERRRPRMPNQTPPELEKQILDMTAQFPTYSYIRIADQLRLVGIGVSAPAVRGVWVRHGITLRLQRLLWLDKKTASEGGVLTEQAKRLLQKHAGRNGDPEQHIEAPHSGYLLCQDTYFVGTIKGVGKVYMQTVIDAHCSQAFAKVYLSKMPITAADTLNDRVIPFYEEESVNIERLLTDNGREYCGREARHPFEIYLAINQIRHKRTQIASPQSNGFCERFHRTIKEEFYSVKFRQKIYQSVAELQDDLDAYLAFYNRQRPHHGYRTQGRTPYQAFLDGKPAQAQTMAA